MLRYCLILLSEEPEESLLMVTKQLVYLSSLNFAVVFNYNCEAREWQSATDGLHVHSASWFCFSLQPVLVLPSYRHAASLN